MKILTVLGTRPEIIRLSRIIARLDQVSDHVLVHTGQNYDYRLSDLFFKELSVRSPDVYLGARGSVGEQLGVILPACEKLFCEDRPDRLLILGDTNSALTAIIAKRMGIPVFHMEAGNRCFDDRVPEEVNRRIIDHTSDVLMPYTERSRQNLVYEGIATNRIFVTGNPIFEVLEHYRPAIDVSSVFSTLGVEPQKYFLATVHRAENVDVPERLKAILEGLREVALEHQLPVIVSTHPRTRARLETLGIKTVDEEVRFSDPFGFFDFVALERGARCVLTDSGTVQEECAIFRVPNVTLRDTTERPETIECGSNVLAGTRADRIIDCTRLALSCRGNWSPPIEYLAPNVTETVVRITLGHHGT